MMESFPGTLRDIHGLDGVPWWPLAPGWWYVLAAIALVPVVIAMGYWLPPRTVVGLAAMPS
jgi:hypothetical protein